MKENHRKDNMIHLYNTLTRQIEVFDPLDTKKIQVKMYSCGPTVYDYQHIGHMRRYVGDDLLIRLFTANGYSLHHVMNITDVGHLVSDSDTGEDKMEKGAKKFGKSVWDIAKQFEEQFKQSCASLRIQLPKDLMHATAYIPDQITLIETLEKKGFTYATHDGIYFDTSKFPHYFQLSRQHPEGLIAGARIEQTDGKKHISDFALWKFSPIGQKRQMEWKSPWGVGFPGWHIECSAMSMKALGVSFDVHTGGIDHIAIHHTNEIAQSEAATGKQFVRFWVHHNFLIVNGEKMSKSLNNFVTVQDVEQKGYDPLALRYLYLQTHYRQEMNFTWTALDSAQTSLQKLRLHVTDLADGVANSKWMSKFMQALNNDVGTAKALAIVWELAKTDLDASEKSATLLAMDKILGLQLDQKKTVSVPQKVRLLIETREASRMQGDFKSADMLRNTILKLGYVIQDTKKGPSIRAVKEEKEHE